MKIEIKEIEKRKLLIFRKLGKNKPKIKKYKKPETERWWTIIYYGARGSGKSLHQAKLADSVLKYLDWLYLNKPKLKQAIVFSVQKFNQEIEDKYLGHRLFYWKDAGDLRYCPRINCWKGENKHRLHGAYIFFDDMATILPADNWAQTPIWFRKTFAQARHFGIRIVANMQDPFSVDVNFRRYTDMAFRFRKIIGSKDPDETKPPVKFIWGIYHRRKIKASLLWAMGDMNDDEIIAFRQKQKQMSKISGNISLYKDIWKGSTHLITRKACELYDTTQDVPEYKPKGYSHSELGCIDPKHNHEDKKADNYCGFKKVSHEII